MARPPSHSATDGRFSGGTSGLSIGHASPEAAEGGAIALVQEGDRILIDLGPSNSDDGEATPSPDYLGQHWNNWLRWIFQ